MPGHVLERAAPQRGPSHAVLWWSCAEGRLEAGALGAGTVIQTRAVMGGGMGGGGRSRSAAALVLGPRPNPSLWHGLDEVLKSHVAAQPTLWDYRGPGASPGP